MFGWRAPPRSIPPPTLVEHRAMGYREVELLLGYAVTEPEIQRCIDAHKGDLGDLPDGSRIEDKANAILRRKRSKARVFRVYGRRDEPDAFVLRLTRVVVQPYEIVPLARLCETDEHRTLKAELGITGGVVFQAFA